MKNTTFHKIIRLKIYSYEFAPGLIPTIATIVVLPLLISLGVWQSHRAEFKKQLESQISSRSQLPPIELNTVLSNPKQYEYYNIKLSGHYDNSHQMLLENRFHNHQLGYEIITPLQLSGGDSVLVNRGWVPRPADSSKLPEINPVNDRQTLTGRIIVPPEKVFDIAKVQYTDNKWPRTLPNISKNSLKAASPNQKHTPFIVQLNPSAKHGYVREWKAVTLSHHKHIGYAIQWYLMAATLIIIFIAVNTRRRRNNE